MSDRTHAEIESYERLAQRFWDRVDQSGGPDSCWPWKLGCNPRGYGNFQFKIQGKQFTFTAARWALGFSLGRPLAWTPELHEEACHHCDNPPCCNPAHLYVGTHAQNLRDAADRGRFLLERNPSSKKTHCPAGHAYSGSNLRIDTKRNRRICRECQRAKNRRHKARLRGE